MAARCLIREDPSLLPVGAMYERALEAEAKELEARVRPLVDGPDRWAAIEALARQTLTFDVRLAPRVPTFPATRWLATGAGLGELARHAVCALLGRAVYLPSSQLFAVVAALLAARVLRRSDAQHAHLVVTALILLRAAGLSLLFAPTLWLATVFTLAPPPR